MKLLFSVVLIFAEGTFVASGQIRTKTASTGSMLPNIPINSILVVDESYYSNRSPSRFDIVVAHREDKPFPHADLVSIQIVARVVGLPGEVISIRKGRLYVNGRWQKEPFPTRSCPLKDDEGFPCRQMPPVRIPSDHYFLLADNRPESEDSRLWSPKTIPRHDVLGKVVRIIPPPPPPNKALQLTARQHVSQVNFCPSARMLIARRS